MTRALVLVLFSGCTTTLAFEGDAGMTPDAGALDARTVDAAVRDAGTAQDAGPAQDAGAVRDANMAADAAVPGPHQAECRDECANQNSNCLSFDASACVSLCDSSGSARQLGFIQCSQDASSTFNCNLGLDAPSCFSVLTGGAESEGLCRSACDRYEACDFIAVSAVCRDRCVTRLPPDNDAFVACVAADTACTLRCL